MSETLYLTPLLRAHPSGSEDEQSVYDALQRREIVMATLPVARRVLARLGHDDRRIKRLEHFARTGSLLD